jgi:hypothetical protein
MRKAYFSFLLVALLAIAGNALMPFLLHPEGADGKILICTAEGFRYVDSSELPKIPVTPHKPHCVLCVLAAVNPPLTPAAEITITLSLTQHSTVALPQEHLALPLIAHAFLFPAHHLPFLNLNHNF